VKTNIPAFSSAKLLGTFLEQEKGFSPSKLDTSSTSHKQSFYSLAKCISVISVGSGNPTEALTVANSFVTDLAKNKNLTDVQVVIALLSIGEIGRHV
jgi:hypothetical protein